MTKTTIEIKDTAFPVTAHGEFQEKDAHGYSPKAESNKIVVDLPRFSGPLDLLLYLIKKHSMDIFDIPIVSITHKYVEAIDEMKTLNLDIAGEFLLMAATLAEIKSQMLLPEEKKDDEELPAEDPRKDLVQKLLEYQKFQKAAAFMSGYKVLGRDIFSRHTNAFELDPQPTSATLDDLVVKGDPFDLIKSLSAVLARAKPAVAHQISSDSLSVGARIVELIDWLSVHDESLFTDILLLYVAYDRREILVNFLAVLEMAKRKLVRLSMVDRQIKITSIQENLLGDFSNPV